MPIFHFNLADHKFEEDVEGTELASKEAARVEAITFAGSYLRDNPEVLWDGLKFKVQVTDEERKPLFVVSMEAIDC